MATTFDNRYAKSAFIEETMPLVFKITDVR